MKHDLSIYQWLSTDLRSAAIEKLEQNKSKKFASLSNKNEKLEQCPDAFDSSVQQQCPDKLT